MTCYITPFSVPQSPYFVQQQLPLQHRAVSENYIHAHTCACVCWGSSIIQFHRMPIPSHFLERRWKDRSCGKVARSAALVTVDSPNKTLWSQVEQTEFADRWGCLGEGRGSGAGEGGRASALCEQKGWAESFAEMRKPGEEQACWEKDISNWVWGLLRLRCPVRQVPTPHCTRVWSSGESLDGRWTCRSHRHSLCLRPVSWGCWAGLC